MAAAAPIPEWVQRLGLAHPRTFLSVDSSKIPRFDEDRAAELAAAFRENPNSIVKLLVLDVSHLPGTSWGAKELSKAVSKLGCLKRVRLMGSFGDNHILKLMLTDLENTKIETIDLEVNHIDATIGSLVRSIKSLKAVQLWGSETDVVSSFDNACRFLEACYGSTNPGVASSGLEELILMKPMERFLKKTKDSTITCQQLKILRLSGTVRDDERFALESFFESIHHSNVQTLTLDGISMSSRGVAHLAASLSSSKSNLGVLCLERLQLTAEELALLLSVVCSNNQVHTLSLYGTLRGVEAKGEIVEALLRSNRGIHYLNLSYNGLEDEDLLKISIGLRHNSSLEHLNLSSNSLTRVKDLALCLRDNGSLVSVDLALNFIENLEYFTDVLVVRETALHLDLQFNPLDDETGLSALTRALELNGRLGMLNVSVNSFDGLRLFSEQSLSLLFDCFKTNEHLKRFRIIGLDARSYGDLVGSLSSAVALEHLSLSSDEIDRRGLLEAVRTNVSLLSLDTDDNCPRSLGDSQLFDFYLLRNRFNREVRHLRTKPERLAEALLPYLVERVLRSSLGPSLLMFQLKAEPLFVETIGALIRSVDT